MTGRRQLTLIDEDRMDAMGIAAFASLKADGKLSQDPGVNEYVVCIARAVLEVVPQEYQPDGNRWEWYVKQKDHDTGRENVIVNHRDGAAADQAPQKKCCG